jgi:hypothetical protein
MLGWFSIAQPAHRIGPVRSGPVGAIDELVVHPRHLLKMLLRRRALKLTSLAFLMATPWCREQRLLAPNQVLRWEAETALLSSLGIGFAVGARLIAFLLRFEPKATARTDAEAPVELGASSDALARLERSPGMAIQIQFGRARRRWPPEVRHGIRADRSPADQVPRKPV